MVICQRSFQVLPGADDFAFMNVDWRVNAFANAAVTIICFIKKPTLFTMLTWEYSLLTLETSHDLRS